VTTYRVSTPVVDFTGEVGTCQFVKGVYEGEVPDGTLSYFETAGYTVEKLAAKKAAAKAKDPADPADPAADDAAASQNGASA
jgi:hypothetical protein